LALTTRFVKTSNVIYNNKICMLVKLWHAWNWTKIYVLVNGKKCFSLGKRIQTSFSFLSSTPQQSSYVILLRTAWKDMTIWALELGRSGISVMLARG
jgi:hypothetical protein